MKTLILYTFDEINENVIFFLQNTYFVKENYKFLFILNGDINFEFPSDILILKRDNIGFDFGGWNAGLFSKKFTEDYLYKYFDFFVFINKSTIGPFYPKYIENLIWTDIFTSRINEMIKLVGPTINTYNEFGNFNYDIRHVQSYLFATDIIGINLLINEKFFKNEELTFETKIETIISGELLMSKLFLKNNYNIACLQKKWYNTDFREKIEQNDCPRDMMFNYFFQNGEINALETVFIKGNRGIFENFYK